MQVKFATSMKDSGVWPISSIVVDITKHYRKMKPPDWKKLRAYFTVDVAARSISITSDFGCGRFGYMGYTHYSMDNPAEVLEAFALFNSIVNPPAK